jgi:membrane protein DedA with SNARE-associated domain
MSVDHLLQMIPPLAVYLLVGLVVGIESLGVPMPGEIVLVTAALLSSQHELAVSPLWIGVAGSAGAIIGDSIGYAIGHRYGRSLFDRAARRFPKHFKPSHIEYAERMFIRWGVVAVFFGRFIALLRILAGPLAGTLRMPYPKFLVANMLGGVLWAGGTTVAVYSLGVIAETWLSRFSYLGLLLTVVVTLTIGWVVKRRALRFIDHHVVAQESVQKSSPPAGPRS